MKKIILSLVAAVLLAVPAAGYAQGEEALIRQLLKQVVELQEILNRLLVQQQGAQTGWKTYVSREYGFSFKYPPSLKEAAAVFPYLITLERQVSIPHCSAKGDPCKPTTANPSIGVFVDPRPYSAFVSQYHGQDLEPIEAGGVRGSSYEMGAEGEGVVFYMLPLGSKTLVLSQSTLDPASLLHYRGKPGVIGLDEQRSVAKNILNTLTLSPASETMALTLYFRSSHPTDCSATRPVVRTAPKTLAVADASLKALFLEDLPELRPSYLGVSIAGGVATVRFDEGAMRHLGGPACLQESFKSPIEKTLLQFPAIKEVRYSVGGRIITEWDA